MEDDYTIKTWFPRFLRKDTPSCIVLGFEIDDDDTCDDIYRAFNYIFFGTFIMIIIMLSWRVLKVLVTFTKVLYFAFSSKTGSRQGLSNTKICQLLLSELSVISDKYCLIWSKQTKAEIFEKFRKHREDCAKCKDKHCVRNTLHNFLTQNKVDLKDKTAKNEVEIVFLNKKYNINNNERGKCRKMEKGIMKVNEWFEKQLNRYEKCMKIKDKATNKDEEEEDSDDDNIKSNKLNETEQRISLADYKKVVSSSDNKTKLDITGSTVNDSDGLRKEISSNIDEIQLNLNINESNNISNNNYINAMTDYNTTICSRSKRINSLIKRKQQYFKNIVYLMPDKEYPMWLFQSKNQLRIILKRKKSCAKLKKDVKKLPRKNLKSTYKQYFVASSNKRNIIQKNDTECNNKKGEIKKQENIMTLLNKSDLCEVTEDDNFTKDLDRIDENLNLFNDIPSKNIENVHKVEELELNHDSEILNEKQQLTNKMINKAKTVKKIIVSELQNKSNKGNEKSVISNNEKQGFRQKNQLKPLKKNETQKEANVQILNQNLNFHTHLPNIYIFKGNVKGNNESESNNSVEHEFQCHTDTIPDNSNSPKKLLSSKKYSIPEKSHNWPLLTNENTLTKTEEVQLSSGESTNNNSVKEEILSNIVNLPTGTKTYLKYRYKLHKCTKSKQMNDPNRLDIIFEH